MNDRLTGLQTAREDTIDALCRRFADDALSLGELERRLERARTAQSRQQLDALLADLNAPAPSPPAVREEAQRPPERDPPARSTPARSTQAIHEAGHVAIAIMGGTRRAGRWAPPSEMMVAAVMGGVELDFRDAVLRQGVTEINCFAFWGGVDITVPPDVHVETQGFALLGGFDQVSELNNDPPPDAPVIRISGFALMGGVSIKVRERGDTRGSREDPVSRNENRLQRHVDRHQARVEGVRERHEARLERGRGRERRRRGQ